MLTSKVLFNYDAETVLSNQRVVCRDHVHATCWNARNVSPAPLSENHLGHIWCQSVRGVYTTKIIKINFGHFRRILFVAAGIFKWMSRKDVAKHCDEFTAIQLFRFFSCSESSLIYPCVYLVTTSIPWSHRFSFAAKILFSLSSPLRLSHFVALLLENLWLPGYNSKKRPQKLRDYQGRTKQSS